MANILYDLNLSSPLDVQYGGTEGDTPSIARTNLGLSSMAIQDSSNVAITGGLLSNVVISNTTLSGSLALTTPLSLANGGLGSTTPSGGRSTLGLGTIATQDSSAVSITGGSIDGSPIGDILRSPLLTVASGAIRTVGGNPRGLGAVDLQVSRANASQVASGNYSFLVGQENSSSGTHSLSAGYRNVSSGSYSMAVGRQNQALGTYSSAIGLANYTSGNQSISLGESNYSDAPGSIAIGAANTISSTASGCMALGDSNQLAGSGYVIGQSNNVLSGTGSACLGNNLTINASKAIAIGNKALASRANEIALGLQNNFSFTASQLSFLALQSYIINAAVTPALVLTIKNNSTAVIRLTFIASSVTSSQRAIFKGEAQVVKSTTPSSIAFLGSPSITNAYNDLGVSTPSIVLNTTTGNLDIQTSGLAGLSIVWHVEALITEIVF
jgi:hypothetical protein